jgi:hypothetical protein
VFELPKCLVKITHHKSQPMADQNKSSHIRCLFPTHGSPHTKVIHQAVGGSWTETSISPLFKIQVFIPNTARCHRLNENCSVPNNLSVPGAINSARIGTKPFRPKTLGPFCPFPSTFRSIGKKAAGSGGS